MIPSMERLVTLWMTRANGAEDRASYVELCHDLGGLGQPGETRPRLTVPASHRNCILQGEPFQRRGAFILALVELFEYPVG